MIANDHRRVPAAGRRPRDTAIRLVTLLTAAVILAACGGGSGGDSGAVAPARGDVGAVGPSTATRTPGTPPGTSGAPSAPATALGSTASADGVVTAYFAEINAASRAGRVADVSALALPGCQACALDIGVTRDLQQRGLRANSDPYAISAVTATPRQGLVCAVTFLADTRAVSLVDPAGRPADTASAVPARSGTAELALTGAGWRIQTIRYARRQP
jgi:hypothetical protein